MRPTGIESLRGVQAALMEVIAPELQSAFAQDAARTLQMMLESLANDWDTAAENLHRDNRALRDLLSQTREAIGSLPQSNDRLGALVKQIDSALAGPAGESLAITHLSAENERWRELVERTLVELEDAALEAAFLVLMPVRKAIYAHLREVAARGWSFWDIMSFRERMARLRAGGGR